MTEKVATTKGSILKSLLKFVETDLTPSQKEQALAALTPEERTIATERVLPSTHVPESLLNRLTASAAAAKGEDLDAFGIRAGRAELADAIGLYRFLFIVLTPNALLKKASSTWSSVHDTGAMTVENQTPTSARICLRGFPSERAHCARLTGWFVGLSEMAGAKDVRIDHTVCLTCGGTECAWDLKWS